MTTNEKKVTELLEELEKDGYVIEEIGDKFSPGYFIYDGNLIVAEIYNSGIILFLIKLLMVCWTLSLINSKK